MNNCLLHADCHPLKDECLDEAFQFFRKLIFLKPGLTKKERMDFYHLECEARMLTKTMKEVKQ